MNYQYIISPSSVLHFDTEDYILNLTILIQYILYSKLKRKEYKKIDKLVYKILRVRDTVPIEIDSMILNDYEVNKEIDKLQDEYKELKLSQNPKECIELLLKSYILATDELLKEDLHMSDISDSDDDEKNEKPFTKDMKTFINIRKKTFDEILSFF